jgi:O-antigen/teichoic acid export membrane protein
MLRKLLSLLSDIAVYGASSLLSQLINFLLLPVYTRYIDPNDNGVYSMIMTVTMFSTPLMNLGMTNAVFRRFNVEKEERRRGGVLTTGFLTILLATLSVLAIGLVFAQELARLAVGNEMAFQDPNATQFVRLGLLTVAASAIGAAPLAVLRADRRVRSVLLINVARVLLTVSSTIYLVVAVDWGVRGVFVGAVFGEVSCAGALFAITARSFRFAPSLTTWKRMASYGLPFVPHQIQGMAMEMLPAYAVGYLLGLPEAGLYNIALRFAMPLTFIVNAAQNAWVPYKFQIHANDDDPPTFFRTAVTYYVAGILYLWVGVSLWGPELVWLMTDKLYHPSALLIPVVGLIPVSRGIYFMLGTGLELSDDTRPMPLVTLAGLTTAAATAAFFIPLLGVAGGAISAASSFVALTVVLYYFSQQRFPIQYDWSTLLTLGALAAIAVTIGYIDLKQPAILRIPLAVAISLVFPFAEFAVLWRSSTERHRMRILYAKVRLLSMPWAKSLP